MFASTLSLLSIVGVAAGPSGWAAVSASGEVSVSRDRGHTWRHAHTCPPAPTAADGPATPSPCPQQPALATWLNEELFIACSDGSNWHWSHDAVSASPAPFLQSRTVDAATAGAGRLVFADGARVYEVRDQGPVAIATAPEPVTALASLDDTLVVTSDSAVWRGYRATGRWSLMSGAPACAVAASGAADNARQSFWLAGPDGLQQVRGNDIRHRWSGPLSGIAIADGELLLADGGSLQLQRREPRAAVARDANPMAQPLASRPRVDLLALESRRAWSRLLPDLSARVSISSVPGEARSLRWSIWLSWVLEPADPLSGVLP